MKAITLNSGQLGGGVGDQSLESRDRRTSTTNNQEGYSQSNNPGASTAITGLGNIDGSVHHYELPNLSQRKRGS